MVKSAKCQDLVAKWVVVEYEDGYLDTPTNLKKALELRMIEMTLSEPTPWDLKANFSGSGWANGVIRAKAGNFTIFFSYVFFESKNSQFSAF